MKWILTAMHCSYSAVAAVTVSRHCTMKRTDLSSCINVLMQAADISGHAAGMKYVICQDRSSDGCVRDCQSTSQKP